MPWMTIPNVWSRWVNYTEGGLRWYVIELWSWLISFTWSSNDSPGPYSIRRWRIPENMQIMLQSWLLLVLLYASETNTKTLKKWRQILLRLKTLTMVLISDKAAIRLNSLSWLSNAKWLMRSRVIAVTLVCCINAAAMRRPSGIS